MLKSTLLVVGLIAVTFELPSLATKTRLRVESQMIAVGEVPTWMLATERLLAAEITVTLWDPESAT